MDKDTSGNPALAWIEYKPNVPKARRARGNDTQQQKVVRSHVARTSAGIRKATIAKKGTSRVQPIVVQPSDLFKQDDNQIEDNIFSLLKKFRYRNAIADVDITAKTVRTSLWRAFTGNSTCFNAALFVAGTFANTCGIPSSALHSGFGSGLLFLRGASLEAIQQTVMESPNDSLNSISIALLAGWERRFGEPRSHEIHMQAWKALPLSTGSLDSGSIAALADMALESFREASEELSLVEARGVSRVSVDSAGLFLRLPPGFEVIPRDRPEAASLLRTIAIVANSDPRAPDAVEVLRRLGIENMSWSACHSVSAEPSPAYEDSWNQTDLNALYHIRSALITIIGILLRSALDINQITWSFDMQSGVDIHAEACQNLRSKALMGTKYQDIAIWAKLSLSAFARRSQSGNVILEDLMACSGIEDWEQLEYMLQKHIYMEPWVGSTYRRLYDTLHYRS